MSAIKLIFFYLLSSIKLFMLCLIGMILNINETSAQSIFLNTVDPVNGYFQIIYPTGLDTFKYHVLLSNIPPNTNVTIYQSLDSTFNPYNNQGDSIGFIPYTSIPNDFNFSQCIKQIGVFINACEPSVGGLEQRSEYLVMTSGTGIKVSNLAIDFSPQNNNGSSNHDINIGTNPCGYKTPSSTLISALQTGSCNSSNIIAASPTDSIPANSLILLFTSDSVDATYNINGLCNYGYPIYVLQNACVRTSGAFTNSPDCSSSRYRTSYVINTLEACKDSFTYDLCGISNTDGVFAERQQGIDTASMSNNGILNNQNCLGTQCAPKNFSLDTILKFPIVNQFCVLNYYVKGITTPPYGNPIFSNNISYQLKCSNCYGENLMPNGNFEDTTFWFSHDDNPATGALYHEVHPADKYLGSVSTGVWPGDILFVKNQHYGGYNYPFQYYSVWDSAVDHTTGTGWMLHVDGPIDGDNNAPTKRFFIDTVNVQPNTNYEFAFFLRVVGDYVNGLGYNNTPPKIGVLLDGVPQIQNINVTDDYISYIGTNDKWQEIKVYYNSASDTQLIIGLVDSLATLNGNNFYIDDMSFKTVIPCSPVQCISIDTFNCKTLTYSGDSSRFCIPLILQSDSTDFADNGFQFCMSYDTNFVKPTGIYNQPFDTTNFTVTIDSIANGSICITISNVQHITFNENGYIDLGCMEFLLDNEQFTYYSPDTKYFYYRSFSIPEKGCEVVESFRTGQLNASGN